MAVIKLLEARRGNGKRKRFTIHQSHRYFLLGKGPIEDENRGRGDGDRNTMNERRPWDDSDDDEETEMSRVSQTLSTSIFDLSSVTSLYTDSGPLAFPQAPHKKPQNSTKLYPPASILIAIQQKSYSSQRNRPPLLLLPLRPLLLNPPLPCPM